MIALLLLATFLATVLTGPAGKEYLAKRRLLLDAPTARVTYLPSGECRGPGS